jgi:hypothetical protein
MGGSFPAALLCVSSVMNGPGSGGAGGPRRHIEAHMDTLVHGWIPPVLSATKHSCVHCSDEFSEFTRVTHEINAGGSSRFYMF